MVYKIIRSFKITSKYRGYSLIVDAVNIYIENNGKSLQITKDIYPILATKHQTSIYSVERNIRTIIEICWQNDKEAVEKLLGYKTSKCPSNSVFIDAIAYNITMDTYK